MVEQSNITSSCANRRAVAALLEAPEAVRVAVVAVVGEAAAAVVVAARLIRLVTGQEDSAVGLALAREAMVRKPLVVVHPLSRLS